MTSSDIRELVAESGAGSGVREDCIWASSAAGRATVGGNAVDGIARFHAIGRPPRSEQPIEIPSVRALVFGDAIVEIGDGELRIWETPPDSDRRRRWWNQDYLPTLEWLATLDIEHVLVTHGQPAIGEGKQALQRALKSGPWQRPKHASERLPRLRACPRRTNEGRRA